MEYKFEMNINGNTSVWWLKRDIRIFEGKYIKHHKECFWCFDMDKCKICEFKKAIIEYTLKEMEKRCIPIWKMI